MGRNTGEDISKKLSSKYIQKLLDHAKKSAINQLKTVSKRANQKAAKASCDLTGKRTAYR